MILSIIVWILLIMGIMLVFHSLMGEHREHKEWRKHWDKYFDEKFKD